MIRSKITIIGSNNMDLITYTERMPRKGETIFGRDFELGFGGKGANQAAAIAKLGAEVTMVTKVGDDLFGPEVIKNFERLGVKTEYIEIVEGVSSGVAPIFVDPEGNNRIFVVKGANDHVNEKDVDKAEQEIEGSDFVVLQLEIPIETVYYCIEVANQHSTPVILNPAPAAQLDMRYLKKVFVFAPNESEMETITEKSINKLEEAEKQAKNLVDQGITNVILTLGERGSLLVNDRQVKHIRAPRVSSVDTTGAGDAFIGSLAVFLGEGRNLIEAIELANYYAAYSTLNRGTQKSFYYRETFEKRLMENGLEL